MQTDPCFAAALDDPEVPQMGLLTVDAFGEVAVAESKSDEGRHTVKVESTVNTDTANLHAVWVRVVDVASTENVSDE